MNDIHMSLRSAWRGKVGRKRLKPQNLKIRESFADLRIDHTSTQKPSWLPTLSCSDANLIELVGAGQPRGPSSDDGDLLAGPGKRGLRSDPSLLESVINYSALDVFDGHSRLVDTQNASALARRRTDPSSELWKHENSRCLLDTLTYLTKTSNKRAERGNVLLS